MRFNSKLVLFILFIFGLLFIFFLFRDTIFEERVYEKPEIVTKPTVEIPSKILPTGPSKSTSKSTEVLGSANLSFLDLRNICHGWEKSNRFFVIHITFSSLILQIALPLWISSICSYLKVYVVMSLMVFVFFSSSYLKEYFRRWCNHTIDHESPRIYLFYLIRIFWFLSHWKFFLV